MGVRQGETAPDGAMAPVSRRHLRREKLLAVEDVRVELVSQEDTRWPWRRVAGGPLLGGLLAVGTVVLVAAWVGPRCVGEVGAAAGVYMLVSFMLLGLEGH
mmetsp:Transcript_44052/g.108149  ORF Transcript_44052/g.108149 Transcript_44052/m.108149 type:complete len:101 (-) Transcript_44052:242-544(-)